VKKTFIVAATAFCALALAAQTGSERPAISAMEKGLDSEFTHLWPDEPFLLLGATRGVYLDGYGAVFTTELNLVTGPVLTPMNPVPTKEMIDRQRQRKLERLPRLRDAMRGVLVHTASSLDTLPKDQQVVLAVTLARYRWEDTNGMPSHIIMQGRRGDLLEAKDPGALAQVIRTQEY